MSQSEKDKKLKLLICELCQKKYKNSSLYFRTRGPSRTRTILINISGYSKNNVKLPWLKLKQGRKRKWSAKVNR